MSQVEVKRRQLQSFGWILGIVILLGMAGRIGGNGIAYLIPALETFAVLALLLAEYVPDALGKVLKARKNKGQYKNADQVRLIVLFFQVFLGLAGTAFMIAVAGVLAEKVFHVPYSAFPLRLLAPALFFRVIGGVILGYFYGNGDQMPAVIASFLRQLLFLLAGLLLVPLFCGYGEKVSALLLNDSLIAMYGAAGLSIAVDFAELLVLLFLILFYLISGRRRAQGKLEGMKRTETAGSAIRALCAGLWLPVLTALFTKLPVSLGILFVQGGTEDPAAVVWDSGVYYGGYLAFGAIVVLLCEILLLPVASRAASCFRKMELRYARDLCGMGLHLGMVYALFPAAFGTVLAAPLARLLCGEGAELLTKLLQTGSALVVGIVMALYFVRILSQTEKMLWSLGLAGLLVIVYCPGALLFVDVLGLGVSGLVYAGLIGVALVCILSGVLLVRQMKLRMDWIRWIGIPAISALLSGLCCLLLGKLINDPLGDLGTLIICLVVGVVIYLAPQVLLRSFRSPELKLLVGGKLLKRLMR